MTIPAADGSVTTPLVPAGPDLNTTLTITNWVPGATVNGAWVPTARGQRPVLPSTWPIPPSTTRHRPQPAYQDGYATGQITSLTIDGAA
jgi:flagellar hook protein FlgE